MRKTQGILPARSVRQANIQDLPKDFPSGVKILKSQYILTYVESIENIDSGPISAQEVVDSWVIDNGIIRVEAVLEGGSLVSIKKDGNEYLWQNVEGGTYYGANSNAFPLTRGLILHGGIRVAAVTAEHGLYYDTDWDIAFDADSTGSTINLSIKDSQENRELLADRLSQGLFCDEGSNMPMSKYPITEATYTFTVSLRPGEDFVRIKASLFNPKEEAVKAEIWLPQTYPVNKDSQVISHQKKRRCKDIWVYQEMLKENYLAQDMSLDPDRNLPAYKGKSGVVVGLPSTPIAYTNANLDKPLDWPTPVGAILYDYPHQDGSYHAVSFGDGRGAAYVSVSDEGSHHYIKMWSWGDPALFDRQEALKKNPPLAAGRPKTEYYEPWASAFNTAFFELNQFPHGEHSWEAAILPIESGLEKGLDRNELIECVDEKVNPVVEKLNS